MEGLHPSALCRPTYGQGLPKTTVKAIKRPGGLFGKSCAVRRLVRKVLMNLPSNGGRVRALAGPMYNMSCANKNAPFWLATTPNYFGPHGV